MEAILFALLSSVSWAVGDIFGTKAARKIGGYNTALWSYIFGLCLLSFYAPFQLSDLKGATIDILVITFLLGAIGTIPFIAIYEALRLGNASLVYTIGSASVGLIVILSIVFLGEKISTNQAIATLLIFLGIVIAAFDFKNFSWKMIKKDQGFLWALAALVLWGIYYTFISIPVGKIGWFWPNYITLLMFPIIYLSMRIRSIKVESPLRKGVLKPLIASSILVNLAAFSYNFAFTKGGLVLLVAPLSGSYPVLFAVIAHFVFKDKIVRRQIIGIIVTLAGIILLSIFNS